MKSKMQDFLVVDVETGGLPNKTKFATLDVPLMEIALVMVNPELEITAKDSFVIKQYLDESDYHPRALSVNGLTLNKINADGILLKDCISRINDFIVSYKSTKVKPVMAGHNIKSFDLAFFENLYLMHKKDLWKFVNNYVIDTLELSHMCYTEAPNFKLGTMVGQFDIDLVDAHSALPDTVATAEMLINYIKNLRGENGVVNEVQLEEVKKEIENFKF